MVEDANEKTSIHLLTLLMVAISAILSLANALAAVLIIRRTSARVKYIFHDFEISDNVGLNYKLTIFCLSLGHTDSRATLCPLLSCLRGLLIVQVHL